MVDKYGTDSDPACYKGTQILINHLNIKDSCQLEEAEREISTLSAEEIEFSDPPYDLDYLCAIHRTLFQDIYLWAGQIRNVDISKGDTHFCNVNRIVPEAKKLFDDLAERRYLSGLDKASLITQVAELYGDVNMLHPFREGNGRAQRILFEHVVAYAGYEISWENISRDDWVIANIASVNCDYSLLENIFSRCIRQEIIG